jgi:hypothetical protein
MDIFFTFLQPGSCSVCHKCTDVRLNLGTAPVTQGEERPQKLVTLRAGSKQKQKRTKKTTVMAASYSSSSSAQQDHHQRTDVPGGHPRDAKNRHHHIDHLHVQVPVAVPTNSAGCFVGCFRPSPCSASSSALGHTEWPASPSRIRSPTAWIRSFGSGNKHGRRRSRDFQYDASSYARNFDEGGTDGGEGVEEVGVATGDALKYRLFSSRLPTSPPSLSPSGLGPGRGTEPARQTGRDWE